LMRAASKHARRERIQRLVRFGRTS
jgi:hypothetical protein